MTTTGSAVLCRRVCKQETDKVDCHTLTLSAWRLNERFRREKRERERERELLKEFKEFSFCAVIIS
jgi:hypothetical protein